MTIEEFTEVVRTGTNAAAASHHWNDHDKVHVCEWRFDEPRYYFGLFLAPELLTDADDVYVQAITEEVRGRYERVISEAKS